MNALPRDLAAEKAALGACMESTEAARTLRRIVGAGDFWDTRNAVIFGIVCELVEESVPADPVLLNDRIRATGNLRRVPAEYVAEVYAAAPLSNSVEHFAHIVADCAVRRRVMQAGERLMDRASDPQVDTAELITWAGEQVSAARDETTGVESLSISATDFLSRVPSISDPVVPGLLERGDRLVLTGSGGLGKSTLSLQIAMCAAAGINPLDWKTDEYFDPIKVTWIDNEVNDRKLKPRVQRILGEIRHRERHIEDRMRFAGHGQTLDVLNPHTAMSLLRTIEQDKPDLVYIGPFYKLHNEDPDREVTVKKVTGVLDKIRDLGCAIILEAHHGKQAKNGGSLEPSGSNMWTWWPEFGLGMRLDQECDSRMRRCNLERWRIDRDENGWPSSIENGADFPWIASPPLPVGAW